MKASIRFKIFTLGFLSTSLFADYNEVSSPIAEDCGRFALGSFVEGTTSVFRYSRGYIMGHSPKDDQNCAVDFLVIRNGKTVKAGLYANAAVLKEITDPNEIGRMNPRKILHDSVSSSRKPSVESLSPKELEVKQREARERDYKFERDMNAVDRFLEHPSWLWKY